jgi:hypothetical protein
VIVLFLFSLLYLLYEDDISFVYNCKHGGLDLSQRGLDQDSQSRRQKSISLDVMDILDGFQKLVSMIEKSRSRSRFLDLVSMRSAKTVLFSRDQDFSRQIKTFVILIYLGRDIYFSCRNLWKVVGEAQGKLIKVKVKPSPTTFHRCLKSKISRSRLKKSQFISTKSRFISTKSRFISTKS